MRDYATARAEFNGFIQGIETHLIEGTPMAQSEAFAGALDTAVSARRRFTGCVDALIDKIGTTKSVKDYITAASQLTKLLLDAGIKIWQEYRDAADTQRKALLEQLDGLMWRRFSELTN